MDRRLRFEGKLPEGFARISPPGARWKWAEQVARVGADKTGRIVDLLVRVKVRSQEREFEYDL